MTVRARPVSRGSGRSGWNSGDRRTTLLNAGFVAAIVVSILILIGYSAWSWYDDHFGAAATVDGTTITKDQLRTRFAIEAFRIDYTESRIQTLLTAGRISDAEATSQIQFLEQRRSSLGVLTLERLIDVTIQAKLAVEEGVSVSDADIDAQILDESTMLEERHSWVIEVAPKDDEETGEPGDEEKAAARATAEAALSDLRAGKAWDDVAKTTSTASNAAQNGDLGWIFREGGMDEAFTEALFEAAQDEPTDVIEGEDGIFRIGRVTEISPAVVDDTFEARLLDDGIAIADYREAVRADLVRQKLDEKIVAQLSEPSNQRHVLQIYLPLSTPVEGGVRVRHILYAPKDDPQGAADLAEDDPAWAAAEAEARAAYDTLSDDITKFDELARTVSDEGSAKTTGGKLPAFYDEASALDEAFKAAILVDGLEPGDLLEPVRSQFGWHVIQVIRFSGEGGDKAWLESVRQDALDGADFEQLAIDQGEGEEAADGGDIGWVAVGQLDEALEDEIFGTEVGGITDVVEIEQDGAYLFKVVAEEEREPTDEQIAIFESTGFTNWYSEKKAEVEITRSGSAASVNE